MAVSAYVDKRQYSSPATSNARSAAEQQQKQRNDALTAAYGDRSSLEDIQKAMEMYEVSKQSNRGCFWELAADEESAGRVE